MNGIHHEAKTFGNIVGLSNPRIGGIEVPSIEHQSLEKHILGGSNTDLNVR
jgi:hypothetical protein